MATVYDVLARAHELIQQGWCQHAAARDADGRIWYGEGKADSFCALGALYQAETDLGVRPLYRLDIDREARRLIAAQIGKKTPTDEIPLWNDRSNRTQKEVLAVFAKAAEKARVEGEK